MNIPIYEMFGATQNPIPNNWPAARATMFAVNNGLFTDELALAGSGLVPQQYVPQEVATFDFCDPVYSIHTADEVVYTQQTFYAGSSQLGSGNGLAVPVWSGNGPNLPQHSIGYYIDHACVEDVDQQSQSRPFLRAVPSPIHTGGSNLGQTTLYWNWQPGSTLQVWVGTPANGNLFAQSGDHGSASTGVWVTDGMPFSLQDISNGNPPTQLTSISVSVQP